MSEDLEVLRMVIGRLETAHIPYMLTGSVAANYYGVPRMTRDINLVIEISPHEAGRLTELFRADFYIEPDAVERAANERLMFNAIHMTLIVKVDFIVRKDSEYRREEFRRRRPVMIDGVATDIVAPEDLIISKLDWARDTRSEVQMADVRNLLDAVPDLDHEYLMRVDKAPGTRAALSRGDRLNDTPPEVARKYRALLLQRSGAERLNMGSSMFATARTLLVASLRERNPDASPADIRRTLFLRLYGADFRPAHAGAHPGIAGPGAGASAALVKWGRRGRR